MRKHLHVDPRRVHVRQACRPDVSQQPIKHRAVGPREYPRPRRRRQLVSPEVLLKRNRSQTHKPNKTSNPERILVSRGCATETVTGRRPPGAANVGIRNRGSGDGSSRIEPNTPPATAIHSAGRSPSAVPSSPPSSAPAGVP